MFESVNLSADLQPVVSQRDFSEPYQLWTSGQKPGYFQFYEELNQLLLAVTFLINGCILNGLSN